MPDIKLIDLLRNPVDRAYSQYQMGIRMGKLKQGSFREYIEMELQGQQNSARFLDRSLYAKHLRSWFRHFPRKQMLILKSEDFFNDPKCHMGAIEEKRLSALFGSESGNTKQVNQFF